jgi:hypothetical protein
VAEAFNVNLDHELEVTLWKNGTFQLSSSTIEDLVKKSSAVDFALFVFTPDDLALIRGEKLNIVRDNVLFELGLFIGAIGKDRCFIIKPRGLELHLPTDLLGVNTGDYENSRSDGDLVSATNRACSLVKAAITKKGLLEHVDSPFTERPSANPENYAVDEADVRFLVECSASHTSYPTGLSFGSIGSGLRQVSDAVLRVAAIKVERLGYVEKTIETDNRDGEPFYAYRITEDGINAMLRLAPGLKPPKAARPKPSSGFEDMEDDIPF